MKPMTPFKTPKRRSSPRQSIVTTGGEGGINGGIIKPEQEGPWPANMAFYIDVDNLETYLKRIKGAGGKVIVERMEIADMGALSLFEDPEGRVNGLWQQLKK